MNFKLDRLDFVHGFSYDQNSTPSTAERSFSNETIISSDSLWSTPKLIKYF